MTNREGHTTDHEGQCLICGDEVDLLDSETFLNPIRSQ